MAQGKIWLILLLGIAVYISMAVYASIGDLSAELGQFRWFAFFLAIALTSIAYAVRFQKWSFFLRLAGVSLPLRENLFVFTSGLSMVVTPGKVGEVWKAWLIRELSGDRLSITVPVVAVDRITDVLGLAILSFLGIMPFRDHLYLSISVLFAAILLAFALRSRRIMSLTIAVLSRRAAHYSGETDLVCQTFNSILEPRAIALMSLLSAAGWLFEGLCMYVIVLGFNQEISPILSIFIFSFASLAGAVSFLPGGLGVAEATIWGMLSFLGIPPASAVAIAIVVRLVTLWYGAALGLAVHLLFRGRMQRFKV